MGLLDPHPVVAKTLAIARATSKPPAHLLMAGDFIEALLLFVGIYS
jgi:hypothetical protein